MRSLVTRWRRWRAVLAALALSSAVGASGAPNTAMAQSRMSSTFGDMTVTVVGGSTQSIAAMGDGARVLLDDHEILAESDRITVDGVGYPVEAFRELVANAEGYGLTITVDGRPVMAISELDGMRAAADRGDAGALNDLGVRYATGNGVVQDQARAAELYRASAELGSTVAQSNYAVRLWQGVGVAQDREAAVQWAVRAAEADDSRAQNLLGMAYRDGTGVAQADPVVARTWFEQAAANGHAGAMNEIGVLYALGQGVAVDIGEAIRWYQRSQEAGNAIAASNLAHYYWRGDGVDQDLERAEALFAQSVAAGNEAAAEALAELREEMTQAAATVPAAPVYFFAENGTPAGPLTLEELAQAVADARIGPSTLIWRDGMDDWAAAGSVDEAAKFFAR